MSFVIATPEMLTTAATDLAKIGSTITAANTAAAAVHSLAVAGGHGVRAPGRDRLEDLQYRRGASTVEVWPFARVDGNRGCTVDSSFA
ncbi:Pe-pgrs family protein [Mycobacterium tuberculosis variant bovis BCG str. ATCC 35743]|nr:Pe-pgrs family protein [Mycobacterium tuberculosis variant bovis BCG str. ATCC 35743]